MERTLMAHSLLGHMLASMLFAATATASFTLHAAPVTLDKVVAIVDSNAILDSDLQQAMSDAKQQFKLSDQTIPPDHIFRTEVLRQLILKQAQLERVKRSGIKVDEKTLNTTMSKIAAQEGAASLEEFQAKIDAHGAGSYAALRQRIADDLSISRLRQQQVSARINVSEQDVTNFLNSPQGARASNNEIHVAHLRVSLPESPSAEQIDAALAIANTMRSNLKNSSDVDAVIEQSQNSSYPIEGADMGWRKLENMPDLLAAKVNVLAKDQVTAPIRAVDGFHVIKLLDRRDTSEKILVQQYKVRHILIRPSEIVSPTDAKLRIEQLYQQVKQGANFADLASTFSDDPGSGSNGGELGWVSPGSMVPAFEEVMESTAVGQISEPFQTQYGWHILTVEDSRQEDMTEQHKRNMARQILGERQFEQEVDSWLREVRADAFVEIKDGTSIN